MVSDLETNKYSQATAGKSACVSVTGAVIWGFLCSIVQVCVRWKQEQHRLGFLDAKKSNDEKKLNVVAIVYGN